jgi:predicted metal-dependent phosphotriesterase family hydrolase
MTKARTVLGDVDVSTLGITNAHEHVMIRSGLILIREPNFRLDNPDKSVEELRDFRAFGGGTVVDATPIGVGRDPDSLRLISRDSGLQIVAATGFHKCEYYMDSHWRFHYSAEEIANLFIEEIEVGMDQNGYEGPRVKRSEAKAGVIKVASDYQVINRATQVAFEAAAIAHLATGAPVLTHTEMGTQALEQLRLLESHGVRSQHVVLSHMDRNPDPFLHREVAQTGAVLEYDGPGRVKYFPESTLIALIREMFEAGLGSHIVLGGDTARRSYWKAYGGGPGMSYMLERFVPRLRNEGFTAAQLEQVLVQNPARMFAFASVA